MLDDHPGRVRALALVLGSYINMKLLTASVQSPFTHLRDIKGEKRLSTKNLDPIQGEQKDSRS